MCFVHVCTCITPNTISYDKLSAKDLPWMNPWIKLEQQAAKTQQLAENNNIAFVWLGIPRITSFSFWVSFGAENLKFTKKNN